MRIVFTAPRYAPFIGGVETHTQELATRLAARGHEVTVVTTNPMGDLDEQSNDRGVTVQRVHSWPRRGDPYIARGVGSYVSGLGADIVHVQGYQSALTPMVLATITKMRTPTVLTFHGGANANSLRHAMYPVQRRVMAPWLRRVTKLIVLTEFERKEYSRELRIPAESFAKIPNGCDLPSPNSTRDDQLVSSAGRLDPAKGHDKVIEAFGEFRRLRPGARLRIIGSGGDLRRLQDLVKMRQLADVVEFQSFDATQRQQFADALNESGVIVSMSRAETQPITLLEAARLGCNVGVLISSAGLKELVDDGIAWAISPRATAIQIAEQMDQSISSGFEPRREDLKSWDQVVDETERLYRSLVERV